MLSELKHLSQFMRHIENALMRGENGIMMAKTLRKGGECTRNGLVW